MKARYKITQVNKFYKPFYGGIEKVVEQIADVLSENGFDSEVICCHFENKIKKEIHNKTKVKKCNSLFKVNSHPCSLSFIKELAKVKTDFLHYHQPDMLSAIAHLIVKPKCKQFSVTYHSDVFGYDFIMFFFKPILQFFLKKADKIHVLSEETIKNSMILKGLEEKCHIIPYSINFELLPEENPLKTIEIRKKYNNKNLVLFVGRLVRYKGLQVLIKAAKKFNNNTAVIIIGKGKLKEKLKHLIKKYKLETKVFILENIDNNTLNDYYYASDILVLPSIMKSESFAIVQLEAMARKKPVINTKLNTGVNNVCPHKLTGLTIKPNNFEELAESVDYLIENENKKNILGKNAKQRVWTKFNLSNSKKYYLEFFSI